MSAKRARAIVNQQVGRGEKFPVKDKTLELCCDGAPLDDGTYTIRVLVRNIKTPADARKIATWLSKLVSTRMPKGFVTGKGIGEVKPGTVAPGSKATH